MLSQFKNYIGNFSHKWLIKIKLNAENKANFKNQKFTSLHHRIFLAKH